MTKNKIDSTSLPPNLHSIPEISTQSTEPSALDITPSGDTDALFSDSTLNGSVFYNEKESQQDKTDDFGVKKPGLFDDDGPEDDELFGDVKSALKIRSAFAEKDTPVNVIEEEVKQKPKLGKME